MANTDFIDTLKTLPDNEALDLAHKAYEDCAETELEARKRYGAEKTQVRLDIWNSLIQKTNSYYNLYQVVLTSPVWKTALSSGPTIDSKTGFKPNPELL